MLKIYVGRHGQDEDNARKILNGRRNAPLTEVGRNQARELAEGIKTAGFKFDAVYSSPLRRSMATAEEVCTALGPPLHFTVLSELIERDFGVMTGRSVDKIESCCTPDIIKTDTITYFLSPSGAETFPVLFARAQRALGKIKAKHTDGSVLVITHGDLGKMLFAAYYGWDWKEVLTTFHFGNCELFLLSEDADPTVPHVVKVTQYNH